MKAKQKRNLKVYSKIQKIPFAGVNAVIGLMKPDKIIGCDNHDDQDDKSC